MVLIEKCESDWLNFLRDRAEKCVKKRQEEMNDENLECANGRNKKCYFWNQLAFIIFLI